MITIHPFTKTYQGKTVLNFPGMELQSGQIYAVIGSNGSGKSTLAKVLSGTEQPDASSVKPPLSGNPFSRKASVPSGNPFSRKTSAPSRDLFSRKSSVLSGTSSLGYLPQKPYAFHMSLRRNILLNKDKKDSIADSKANQLIHAFELDALADKNAATLSGGETARMALARLMMKDYSLLILDEPTAAIDMNNTLNAEQAIREYTKRTGAAVLLITHSLKQALLLSDTVMYLENGILIEQGETAVVLNSPATSELKRFLDFYALD